MQNGLTPLHVAAHYDHQEVALLLLEKGASPHATAKVRVWGGGCHRRWGGALGQAVGASPWCRTPCPVVAGASAGGWSESAARTRPAFCGPPSTWAALVPGTGARGDLDQQARVQTGQLRGEASGVGVPWRS